MLLGRCSNRLGVLSYQSAPPCCVSGLGCRDLLSPINAELTTSVTAASLAVKLVAATPLGGGSRYGFDRIASREPLRVVIAAHAQLDS